MPRHENYKNNPLLGGSSPRYAGRSAARKHSDLHGSSKGSGRLFETMKHSDRTENGYGNYPPPPPQKFSSTAAARKARRVRSDIHGYEGRSRPQPPAMPRQKDSSIHGGSGGGIYGFQSDALRDASKTYEEQRRKSPRMSSFTKQEVDKGLKYPPVIKNQGEFQVRKRKTDPYLHGGNVESQRPEFLKPTLQPRNTGHRSWALQEKQFEANAIGLPSLGLTPRSSARMGQHTRYYRPTTFDMRTTSSPRDGVTCERNGAIKNYDPQRTSVINGYSCYVKEHHERAVKPGRAVLPANRGYRDFEKNSRKAYRQNQKRLEAEIRQASANPVPLPSAMMMRTQGLQPVAPMGIYQWPRARRWGCSSGGWRE